MQERKTLKQIDSDAPGKWWHGKGALKRKPWGAIFLLIGPAFLYYVAIILYPLLSTVVTSFTETVFTATGMEDRFIGFDNYRRMLEDGIFHMAVRNTMAWAIIGTALEISGAVLLGMFIYFRVPFFRFYRLAWFTPILVGGVIVAIIFRWFLNPQWGLFNLALRGIGLDFLARDWIGRPETAMASIIAIHGWNRFGYYMVIIFAGLSSVPEDLLDSAAIDGASKLQMSTRILIPLIRPVLVTAATICFLGKMRGFPLVWTLTKGGPMHASEVVATYVHKRAFTWVSIEFGYPSAIAVGWFVIVFIGFVALTRFLKSKAA
jgi:ABC-type sugar transport system permease subunit